MTKPYKSLTIVLFVKNVTENLIGQKQQNN